MMTLLFAVFVVLFAISSTNISKVKVLQQSLQEAFSGPVLSGGRAIQETGDTSNGQRAASNRPVPALTPAEAVKAAMQTTKDSAQGAKEASVVATAAAKLAAKEEQDFAALKRRIDKLVKKAGIGGKVSTSVSARGLKVRLLTDKLFFDSGSAVIKAGGFVTLGAIGGIIARERKHPVEVEGYTDARPIATSAYPSNWQLSGARAGAVIQRIIRAGVGARRVSLGGHAAQVPVASDATATGRARNRRVEIVLTRLHGAYSPQGGGTP
jgi:chemotaxis protein MotB